MFKKYLILGLISGLLAGIAGAGWNWAYTDMLMGGYIDFSEMIDYPAIFGASMFGTVLASVGYFLFHKFMPKANEALFNIVFAGITMASLFGPLQMEFPESIPVDFQGYFYGIPFPMHFFPIVGWLTLKPLFFKDK